MSDGITDSSREWEVNKRKAKMERIKSQLQEVQEQVNNYARGLVYYDEDATLEIMEAAAERLLAEITYFKAKKTAKEKIARIKIANEIRAKKERETK